MLPLSKTKNLEAMKEKSNKVKNLNFYAIKNTINKFERYDRLGSYICNMYNIINKGLLSTMY